jgi:protein-S-isoprenylcysteine O-methyltransferase Ste14
MFPVMIYIYYRLSRREEKEVINIYGDEYRKYMEKTTMFIPKRKNSLKNRAV